MALIAILARIQAQADIAGRLEWIAWAQTATAVGTIVITLLVLAVAVAAVAVLRAANRMLRTLEEQAERLAPHAQPLLERAERVAEDAAEISHAIRRNVENVQETVDDLQERLRATLDGAEARVRHLASVLDAVQGEVEELLIEAAATARGLHVAARTLGGSGRARSMQPLDDSAVLHDDGGGDA